MPKWEVSEGNQKDSAPVQSFPAHRALCQDQIDPPLSMDGETEAQSSDVTLVTKARLQTLILARYSPAHNPSLLKQMLPCFTFTSSLCLAFTSFQGREEPGQHSPLTTSCFMSCCFFFFPLR